MRILVRGDVHLDLVSDGVPRLEEQERVLRHTVEAIERLDPDVFVDLGDLFDRPRPSPSAYAVAMTYLRAIDRGRRAFVLAGNHDKPSRGITSSLEPFLGLGEVGFGEVVVEPRAVDVGGTRLVLLPFVTDWEARRLEFESAQALLDDFVERSLRDCRRAVAFTHLEVPGARLADDERVQRDVGTRIPEALLADDRVLRVYAGHVHRYQTVGKVTVVGSALHVDFGEAADPKGMIHAEV